MHLAYTCMVSYIISHTSLHILKEKATLETSAQQIEMWVWQGTLFQEMLFKTNFNVV